MPRNMLLIGMLFVYVIESGCSGSDNLRSEEKASGKKKASWSFDGGSDIRYDKETSSIFREWVYGLKKPITCVFSCKPNTDYQVFIGLSEAHWDKQGQRILDIETNGRIVATCDTFGEGKYTPHGLVISARSNRKGKLTVLIKANPQSPDVNPAVCGLMLFPAGAMLNVDEVVNGRGPEPLAILGTPEPLGELGTYFRKKEYTHEPLPVFSETRDKLPQPIFDEDPRYVECYWKTWELAFSRFRQPHPGSPLVSNYIDEAFNEALFLWDTAFMTMFCNYGHPYVFGIQSLDNFYCSQLEDGEIVREISEITGEPRYNYAKPGTPASLNHPILAWAEVESYLISGDKERLKMVYPPLVAYYYAYEKIKNLDSGFYLGSWASMDNSPRISGMLCSIDTTSEVVLSARNLAFIARELGLTEDAKKFENEADTLSRKVNDKLWDSQSGFYYDWSVKNARHDVKTIAGYWPLIARIASDEQAARLAAHLRDPKQFARLHMVPTTPADEPAFQPKGHYWRGGVWTPTNVMVIAGLEEYGYHDLAESIAKNHVDNVFKVYQETGTVWEFYQPDAVAVGYQPNHKTRPDFTGWTGNTPIKLFIEYKIGIRINAPKNKIHWHITSNQRVGVRRLWFGNRTADLVCEEADNTSTRRLTIDTPKGFSFEWQLGDHKGKQSIPSGRTTLTIGD